MTDEDISRELQKHARRLERAERENWRLLPVPLDIRAFGLRMQQLRDRVEATSN